MMGCFKQTQAAVQTIFPRSGVNQFSAYLSGANCCFLATNDLKLPLPIIENMRALVARSVKTDNGQEQWFIPVLGAYEGDVLNNADYLQCSFDQEGNRVCAGLFNTNPVFEKKVLDKKTQKVSWTPMSEDPISLYDGYDATAIELLGINDPNNLKRLTALFNNWIVQFSAQSDPLTELGTETGISILSSVTTTRHWVPQSALMKAAHEEYRDTRITRAHGRVINSPYVVKQAVAISSQSVILSDPFEQVLSKWILPVNLSTVGSSISDQTFLQRMQIIAGEPYSQISVGPNEGQNFSDIHLSYATSMVHAVNAPPSSFVEFLLECAKKGRGGFLSGLLASLAGNVLGPQAGAVASSIAQDLPF
jgi:hypothetical protein